MLLRMRSTEVPLEFLQATRQRRTLTVDLGANPFLRPPKAITTAGVDEGISWWEDVYCSGESALSYGNMLKEVLRQTCLIRGLDVVGLIYSRST